MQAPPPSFNTNSHTTATAAAPTKPNMLPLPYTTRNTAAPTTTTTASTTPRTESPTRLLIAQRLQERECAQYILFNVLLLIVLLLPIVICEFYIEPFHRGFFCDDETIRYPFHENTVTNVLLALLLCAVPFVTIMLVEALLHQRRGEWRTNYSFYGWHLRKWLVSGMKQYFYFTYGILLVFNSTEIGKYTMGRLRPHFIAVCQPVFPDGSSCLDTKNQQLYITDYTCQADGFTLADVRQARLSFPSGHSSLGVYAMVYLALFIQMRLSARRTKLAKHYLQFLLLALAWFTALSRVMDNWHHWSDVLLGALLGLVGAILNAKYIAKILKEQSWPMSFKLPLPRHDTTATLHDVV